MNKESNLFTKDKEFESLVKKAKRVSIIKTVTISFFVSLLVFFILYFIGSFIMQSKIDKDSTIEFERNSIQGANINSSGTTYNYSPFSVTSSTELKKTVGGIPIPWGKREKIFTVFGTSKSITTSGANGSSEMGDDRMPMYFMGERVIEFFHPEVEYQKVFDDRKILDRMDENTVVEYAFSFDKAYSIREVEEIFKEHSEWYWVNTFDRVEVKEYSDGNQSGLFPIDTLILGDQAFGFEYLENSGVSSAARFISIIEKLEGVKGDYHINLINKLKDQDNEELLPEKLSIIGVVVTGSPSELKKYTNIPMIKGATYGATAERYIQ